MNSRVMEQYDDDSAARLLIELKAPTIFETKSFAALDVLLFSGAPIVITTADDFKNFDVTPTVRKVGRDIGVYGLGGALAVSSDIATELVNNYVSNGMTVFQLILETKEIFTSASSFPREAVEIFLRQQAWMRLLDFYTEFLNQVTLKEDIPKDIIELHKIVDYTAYVPDKLELADKINPTDLVEKTNPMNIFHNQSYEAYARVVRFETQIDKMRKGMSKSASPVSPKQPQAPVSSASQSDDDHDSLDDPILEGSQFSEEEEEEEINVSSLFIEVENEPKTTQSKRVSKPKKDQNFAYYAPESGISLSNDDSEYQDDSDFSQKTPDSKSLEDIPISPISDSFGIKLNKSVRDMAEYYEKLSASSSGARARYNPGSLEDDDYNFSIFRMLVDYLSLAEAQFFDKNDFTALLLARNLQAVFAYRDFEDVMSDLRSTLEVLRASYREAKAVWTQRFVDTQQSACLKNALASDDNHPLAFLIQNALPTADDTDTFVELSRTTRYKTMVFFLWKEVAAINDSAEYEESLRNARSLDALYSDCQNIGNDLRKSPVQIFERRIVDNDAPRDAVPGGRFSAAVVDFVFDLSTPNDDVYLSANKVAIVTKWPPAFATMKEIFGAFLDLNDRNKDSNSRLYAIQKNVKITVPGAKPPFSDRKQVLVRRISINRNVFRRFDNVMKKYKKTTDLVASFQ